MHFSVEHFIMKSVPAGVISYLPQVKLYARSPDDLDIKVPSARIKRIPPLRVFSARVTDDDLSIKRVYFSEAISLFVFSSS